ncbi:hypothetical protein F4805DRAFT_415223 [Annulohypoxylon moriforme]|nr:hypothetical protein F4805DRAFT_415223 [Annulohypoxylon moriforme]
MVPSSDQAVAHGSDPERSTKNYRSKSNVYSDSLAVFLNHNERPFTERLVAGGIPSGTSDAAMKSALELWQQYWEKSSAPSGNKAGEQYAFQSHADHIFKSKDTTRVRYTEAEITRQITEWVLNWLRWWAASAPLADASSGDPKTSGSSHAPGAGDSSGKSQNSRGAGKRHRKLGKGGDEDSNGQSKKVRTGSYPRDKRNYLACPFLKYNPQRYLHEEKCCKRWPNVSRLKTDHIYHCHQVPGVQCPRCGNIIDNSNKSEHVACEERDFMPREGADSSMMQELRSKSTARNESEEEKWHAVYEILFGVPRYQQPSPYPDDNLHARQEMVAFLQPNTGPAALRLLANQNYTPGWEARFSRDITNEIIGLINRDFQPPGPLTAPNYDYDPSPSSSSGTRGELSSSQTNQTNQSHTEDGYSREFNGNEIAWAHVEDDSGARVAERLVDDLENVMMPAMSSSLSGMGYWN